MPIIIDGYNLLWAITKTGKGSEAITDIGLCRVLGAYLKAVKEKGQIVFDGIGPPDKSGFDNIRNLEVVFTGRAVDADTVIEDKIRTNTAPKRLTVVSSDQRLRKAGRTRKAVSIKSEMFWAEVRQQLSRKSKAEEPVEKRMGLTEGETKQWLDYFGLDEQ
jgi:predicted RNA-binding protein with PIN domain